MRELRFRCFDTLSPKMYTGHSLSIGSNGSFAYLEDDGNWKEYHDDNIIKVMQFTGLKDKNGTGIYESDILKGFRKEQKDKDGTSGYWIQDSVIWRNGGFKLFGRNLTDCYTKDNNHIWQFMWHEQGGLINKTGWYYQIDEIEVIGNIYENPELLTK